VTIIKKIVDEDYNENPDYPSGICDGCHLLISKKEKGENVYLKIAQSTNPFQSFFAVAVRHANV